MPPETFLTPLFALIFWTLIVWVWMYATRLPGMAKADIAAQSAADPKGAWRDRLPPEVTRVADNYNHLHEQPTLFYALMLAIAVIDKATEPMLALAWAYVALRILHSLAQIIRNWVVLRFSLFVAASLVLAALAGLALL